MIAVIASGLAGLRIAERYTRPLAWVIIVVLTCAALFFGGRAIYRTIGSEAVADHEAGIALDIERGGRIADQNIVARSAARDRVGRAARKEFENATIDLPDEGLTCRQRIDLCGELHDAGTDTSLIAECSDICPGKKASSQRPDTDR